MFRRLALSLAVAAGLIVRSVPASATLGVGGFAVRDSLADSSPVENAQFIWGGRNYCWYNSAWRGPGWYWCGYAWRRGIGWGGPPAGTAGTTGPSTSIGTSTLTGTSMLTETSMFTGRLFTIGRCHRLQRARPWRRPPPLSIPEAIAQSGRRP